MNETLRCKCGSPVLRVRVTELGSEILFDTNPTWVLLTKDHGGEGRAVQACVPHICRKKLRRDLREKTKR